MFLLVQVLFGAGFQNLRVAFATGGRPPALTLWSFASFTRDQRAGVRTCRCDVRTLVSGAALVLWQLLQKVVKAQLEFVERSFDLLWVPLACDLGSGQ